AFRLEVTVVNGAKGAKPAARDVEGRVMRPQDYVRIIKPLFQRFDETGKRNRLDLWVEALPAFAGPPCPVRLDLRPGPDYIPGLIPGNAKGAYKEELSLKRRVVRLWAENIKFRGAPPRSGLVSITVDDYERAFLYDTTFTSNGPTPERFNEPRLRLVAPNSPNWYSRSADKFPVRLEVDNAREPDKPVRVGLDRDGNQEVAGDEFQERPGDRERLVFLLQPAPEAAPDGGLLFQTTVRPWSVGLNSSGLYGKFKLEGQMSGPGGSCSGARRRWSSPTPGRRTWS